MRKTHTRQVRQEIILPLKAPFEHMVFGEAYEIEALYFRPLGYLRCGLPACYHRSQS